MGQEKYNFHDEEHEQVWSQIRICRNEGGEILDDLVRDDGQSQKRKLSCLFIDKSSEDLQRSDFDVIVAIMVLFLSSTST